MDLLLQDPYAYLDAFLLMMVRTLAMMVIMPLFSNRNIPMMVKISFSFFLTLMLVNIVPLDVMASSEYPVEFMIVVLKEFITGWLIGFSAYVVFSVLLLAGQFIDFQIGFSMVNVFDPLSQTQITITGNFYYFLFLMIFLLTRSYFFVLQGLKVSFEYIPLGQMSTSGYLYDSLLGVFNDYFLIALRIAAPIFFVMLMTNAVLGILARTVPQLNMFVIGFPIKIILGLFVLLLTMYLFNNVADMIIEAFLNLMDKVIQGMAP